MAEKSVQDSLQQVARQHASQPLASTHSERIVAKKNAQRFRAICVALDTDRDGYKQAVNVPPIGILF